MFVDMKHIVCILTLVLFVQLQLLPAQEEKKLRAAVFDPTSLGTSIDEGTKVAVRELISSTFVNTGKYTMVERSLLDKVMKELKFSNTAVVDDSQATEIGKLAGANKVVLSVITLSGGRNMLSIKTIDVQTATIDLQKTIVVATDRLLEAVEPLTLDMLGAEATTTSSVPEKRGMLSFLKKSDDKKKAGSKANKEKTESPSKEDKEKTESPSKEDKEKEKEDKKKAKENEKKEKEEKKKAKKSETLEVLLEFAGMASNKNPEAKIFVDGKFAGEGTLNRGFLVSFAEKKSGKHKVSVKWEDAKGVIDSEDYKIDSRKQRIFTFECIRGKKRYELILK
jgi:hypothetical protein